jgi:hypothetical protein
LIQAGISKNGAMPEMPKCSKIAFTCGRLFGTMTPFPEASYYYRFPHGNLNISRQADVAAKRRESAETHVFRLTILRREKFTFQCGYQ